MITAPVAALAAALPKLWITKVYVSVPFYVTGNGLTDFVIFRFGALAAPIVSVTLIGVIPPPVIVAVLVISDSTANGAF